MSSRLFHRSAVAVAALCLGSAAVFAQMAPAVPASGAGIRPPAEGPGARPRPPAPPLAETGATTTVTGRVARWLPNPNGEVDGLLLDDGTQVAFPPHLSAGLVAAVKVKDTVQVTGRSSERAHLIRATQIRNSSSGLSVTEDAPSGAKPPAPRDPSALTAMKANGRITTLLYTGRGDVNGVVLDSGTVVRFPPHAASQFGAALKTNGTLFAQGYGTSNAQGSAFEATGIGASADTVQSVFPGPRGPAGGPPQPGARGMPPAAPASAPV